MVSKFMQTDLKKQLANAFNKTIGWESPLTISLAFMTVVVI
jgi:hypothetical protein